MTDLEPGLTFRDPRTQTYWQITELVPHYRVAMRPVDADADTDAIETSVYPGDTLQDKLERDELEPVSFDSDDDEDSETYTCEECDREFDTERGLKSHVTQVHKDTSDEG